MSPTRLNIIDSMKIILQDLIQEFKLDAAFHIKYEKASDILHDLEVSEGTLRDAGDNLAKELYVTNRISSPDVAAKFLLRGSRFEHIRKWAHDRNLIDGSSPEKQMLKLAEEMGELAASIARGKAQGIQDGIGDMIVVLTILAEQYSMNVEDAIEVAWQEIKDRKGRMINGVFVKEADNV